MQIGNAISKVGLKLTAKLGKTGIILKAKSPELLIGAGILLVAGGTYLACRATAKAKDVIEARNIEVDEVRYREAEELEKLDPECTEQEIKVIRKETKSDIFVANVRCAWGITKLYVPAIALEAAGIGCFLASHGIMRKRNAALMAAYEATDKAYKRLKEKQSQEALPELKNDENIIEKKLEEQKNCPFNSDLGPWAFVFDENCNIWQPKDSVLYDQAKAIERVLTNRLNQGVTIFLNDIRTAFGSDIPGPNLEGQLICWDKEFGDTEVNLGLPKHLDAITGMSFWINPQGGHPIYDLKCLRRR